MSEDSTIREKLEEQLVQEHLLQLEQKRKRYNQLLTFATGVAAPILSVMLAVFVSRTESIISREYFKHLAVLIMVFIVGETALASYLIVRPVKQKDRLKWQIAEVYQRHIEESDFNPENRKMKISGSPSEHV